MNAVMSGIVVAAMSVIVVAAPRADEHMLMPTSSGDRCANVAVALMQRRRDGLSSPNNICTTRAPPTA